MRLSETKFIVLDTETTGLDPATDKVVDIALIQVKGGEIKELYSSLVNPEMPIPPESSAVHHIVDKNVQNAPTIEQVKDKIRPLFADAVIVAHNASFDSSMFPIKRPWICTYRLARHIWPDAKQHTNQYLRYWLGLDIGDVSVHRAQGDAWVTAHLLRILLTEYLKNGGIDDVQELWKYTNAPIMVQKMPFGKHKGVPMNEVPREYLSWALGNLNDMDEDLRGTMEIVLQEGISA